MILTWTRDFFGQMRYAIGRTDGEGAVEHAGHENKDVIRVAGLIAPAAPHWRAGRVRNTVDVRHGGTDDDGDQDPQDNEIYAQGIQQGKLSIGELDRCT